MKKTVSVILAAAVTLSLAACSGNSGSPSANGDTTATTAASAGGENKDAKPVWPTTKTVEIICPASAGGLTDSAARIWANYLSSQFPNTNFIVNNDNTGNGTVAMETVRNSPETDGSVLMFYNTGILLAEYTGAYKHNLLNDFQFCTVAYSTSPDGFMLCVAGDSPFHTMDDLAGAIEAAPGTLVTGIQNGSTRQFLAGAMRAATGTDFKTVDSGSEADTITALLGGNIDFAFIQAGNAVQYQEAGDMRILGICQPQRSENYPDVPTMDEQGYSGMNLNALQIVAGPRDMPEEVAEAIAATMEGYAQDETVQNALTNMKVAYPAYVNRDECLKMVEETSQLFKEAAEALGY
ncbi:MAG: tripartite tricarboxylate transporter substrate binding protein [Lachnospiraceae bacterium]|nr:tripartite tricarboxylate transporter substrate binding protein [Lachnospiraceae bacterium]